MLIKTSLIAQPKPSPKHSGESQVTRKTPPADSTSQPKPTRTPEQWADLIKERSTLVGLAEPVGVVTGLLSQPMDNLRIVGDGASALVKGDMGGVNRSIDQISERALNPTGIPGGIYHSALVLRAASGLAVGGIEVYAGMKSKNPYLTAMGGADILGGLGTAALVGDLNGLALGLNLTATVAKTGLVLAKPKEYSRTQKVKTILDAGGSAASSMIKSGIMVTPALGVAAVAGVGQIAYMNHEGFRGRVDAILDRLVERFGRG